MTFENEIFLSYARVDNLTPQADKKGWVETFKEYLEIYLTKHIGRKGKINIWWDTRNLRGNQPIDASIRKALTTSALFVALNSKGYIHPESYCRQEIEYFHKIASKSSIGLAPGNHSRLFLINIQDIKHTEWLKPMDGILGFPIYYDEKDELPGEPLEPGSRQFNIQLKIIGDDILKTLTYIAEITGPSSVKTEKDQQKKPILFLADVSDSLQKTQQRILYQLHRQGLEIISDIPPPYETGGHEQAMKETLKDATLSVHLFSQYPGRKIDKTGDITYPQKQYEIARQINIPRFIWLDRDLDITTIEDNAYKDFHINLENNEPEESTYNIVRESENALIRDILEKYKQLEQSRAKEEPDERGVLLDFHDKDIRFALDVASYLKKIGCQPHLVQEYDDPAETSKELEEKLKLATILIIFYGSVADKWVQCRVKTALRYTTRNLSSVEKCRLQALGIYLAPPLNKDKTGDFRLPGLFNIQKLNHECTSAFHPDTLEPLFSTIGWGTGR